VVAGPALVSAKRLAGCYHALDITGPLVAYHLPSIKAIPQAMQRQEIGSVLFVGAPLVGAQGGHEGRPYTTCYAASRNWQHMRSNARAGEEKTEWYNEA